VGVWEAFGGLRGCLGCDLYQKRLRLSQKVGECKPLPRLLLYRYSTLLVLLVLLLLLHRYTTLLLVLLVRRYTMLLLVRLVLMRHRRTTLLQRFVQLEQRAVAAHVEFESKV